MRQFAENNSDEAFAVLVTRHINLVYSVALRQAGNPHAAEEITQAVFIILAKKAAALRHDKALSSWLFQATRLTAHNFIRSESRRHRREEEAYMQSVLDGGSGAPPHQTWEIWPQIAPLLDDAVANLREKDRQAIVLRFFEGRNLREVGLAVGASEDAAEKRVNRALEKLRKFFTRRGVNSTTAIIAGTISANSIQAAPVALAKSVTAVAIVKGSIAAASTLTLVKGVLNLMAWSKVKIICFTAVLITISAGISVLSVDEYIQQLHFSNKFVRQFRNMPPMLILQETHFPGKVDEIGSATVNARFIGRNQTIDSVIRTAYMESPWNQLGAIFPPNMPTNRYDYIITVTNHPRETFQKLIRIKLGYTAHFETITTNCYVLKLAPGGPKLKKAHSKLNPTRLACITWPINQWIIYVKPLKIISF